MGVCILYIVWAVAFIVVKMFLCFCLQRCALIYGHCGFYVPTSPQLETAPSTKHQPKTNSIKFKNKMFNVYSYKHGWSFGRLFPIRFYYTESEWCDEVFCAHFSFLFIYFLLFQIRKPLPRIENETKNRFNPEDASHKQIHLLIHFNRACESVRVVSDKNKIIYFRYFKTTTSALALTFRLTTNLTILNCCSVVLFWVVWFLWSFWMCLWLLSIHHHFAGVCVCSVIHKEL